MGPTWVMSASGWPQVGPRLAPCTGDVVALVGWFHTIDGQCSSPESIKNTTVLQENCIISKNIFSTIRSTLFGLHMNIYIYSVELSRWMYFISIHLFKAVEGIVYPSSSHHAKRSKCSESKIQPCLKAHENDADTCRWVVLYESDHSIEQGWVWVSMCQSLIPPERKFFIV